MQGLAAKLLILLAARPEWLFGELPPDEHGRRAWVERNVAMLLALTLCAILAAPGCRHLPPDLDSSAERKCAAWRIAILTLAEAARHEAFADWARAGCHGEPVCKGEERGCYVYCGWPDMPWPCAGRDEGSWMYREPLQPTPTPDPMQPGDPATPTPTPSEPEATPTPTPSPAQPSEWPLIPDSELEPQTEDTSAQQRWADVWAAVGRYRAAHSEDWTPDQACLARGAAGIDRAFSELARELGAVGIDAGQSISAEGQRSDALFVARADGRSYEEWHLYEYGRGCVATGPGAYRGLYLRRRSGEPEPVTCGAPLPTITRVDVSRAHGFCASIDVTVKSTSREYCDAAGFINRGECPLRPEGAPDREACESYAVAKAGGLRWRVVSGECEVLPCSIEHNCECGSEGYVNRNPMQAAVAGSGCEVEVCAGEACGRIGL